MIQFLPRTRRAMLVLSAVAGLLPVPGLRAQEAHLTPGARVRITAERWSWEHTEARLLAREGDTLVLERPGAPGIRLSLADIERLEVNTRPRRSGAYALRGALIGAAVGYLGAKLIFDAKYRDDRYNAPAALVVGAPIGALVGVGFGYSLGAERWEPVALRPQAQVPLGSSAAVRVSITLPVP